MLLRKRTWLAGLVCLVMMLAVAQAKALMMAPPPPGARIVSADLVLIGKVTGFGPKMVKAELFKGDTREMQVANLKVDDVLVGKAGKEIKVGFFPPRAAQGGGPRLPRPGLQLGQDQEVCIFLVKHPTQKDMYVAQNFYDAIPKKDNPNFTKDVDDIKKAVKLLAKPMDGLKSKDADERYLTAALLISKYRTPREGQQKTEAVSAEESKLILKTLADADWANRNQKYAFQLDPQTMFFRLGVEEKDGWTPPQDGKFQEEAKKWVKENAEKYRIKRFVADK